MPYSIPRPGSGAAAQRPDEDSLEVPLAVIGNSLLTGTFAAFEIAAAGTTALGAFEAIVLFGTVMSGAGAVVLLVMGVGALFSTSMRAQLVQTNKIVGVITSPAGLPVMVASEIAGYSEKDAVRIGEYAKNIFAAYKLNKESAKGLETLREQLSAASDMREIRDFIHEQFEQSISEPGERESEGPPQGSLDGFDGFHIEYDSQGVAHISGTITGRADDIIEEGESQGGSENSDRGEMGQRPGEGEVDRGGDRDHDEGGGDEGAGGDE
jgi:hypothetical protein